jgi:hypothetical protein
MTIAKLIQSLDGYLRHRAAVEGTGYDLDRWRQTLAQQPAKVFGIHVDYDRGVLMVDEQEPRPGFLRDWKKSQETVPAHYFKAVDEEGHVAYAGPFSTVERGLAHWRRHGLVAEEVPEVEVLAALGATHPLTRDETRRLGLRRFDGRPCPWGHEGVRYVRNNHCVACDARRLRMLSAQAAKEE